MRENSEGEATEEVCVAAIERRLYRVVNIGKSKFERESDRGTSVSQKGNIWVDIASARAVVSGENCVYCQE